MGGEELRPRLRQAACGEDRITGGAGAGSVAGDTGSTGSLRPAEGKRASKRGVSLAACESEADRDLRGDSCTGGRRAPEPSGDETRAGESWRTRGSERAGDPGLGDDGLEDEASGAESGNGRGAMS